MPITLTMILIINKFSFEMEKLSVSVDVRTEGQTSRPSILGQLRQGVNL